ncbi:MAG: putative metal-binding motif-containing protein, partial [Deltaproteobacteria bacterium]|nr:putative metal-binding motif-containing protein [Deltaproteobacteria bacterium]
CDGRDNDCSLVADDNLTFVDYYPDGDGDGYGDESALATSTCDGPPLGTVIDHTDCDDADPRSHPGADEISDDGIDQDCTGFDRVTTLTGSEPFQCGCNAAGASASWVLPLWAFAFARRRRSP